MELKLHHSAPIEMLILMISLFNEIVLVSFWPKPLDYIIIVQGF